MSNKAPRSALYDTLGIAPSADSAEIKRAFRQAAKTSHPDAGGTAQAFEEVKRAHLVLSDPARRAKYDATGEIDEPIVDQTTANAMSLIGQLVTVILSGEEDPMGAPLIDAMKIHIGKSKTEFENQIATSKRAKKRAEKMRRRFQRRSAGDNAFLRILDWNIRNCNAEIALAEQATKAHARAIEILAEYTYEPEVTNPFATFSFFTASSGSNP